MEKRSDRQGLRTPGVPVLCRMAPEFASGQGFMG